MYMVQDPPKYNDVICEQPLTVPSDEAVKNSDPVLLDIHMVLNTGSVWEADRGISPTGLPPVLK